MSGEEKLGPKGDDLLEQLRKGWSAQTIDIARFDEGELRARARHFERTLRWRNAREYVAGGIVVVLFGGTAVLAKDPVAKLGAALEVLGALAVMFTLATRGAPQALSEDALAWDCLAWRKNEIMRQRDLLAGIWRWYLGPLAPGLVLLTLSGARRSESLAELALQGAVALLGLAVFVGIGRMNRSAAQQLDEELKALSAESQEGS